MPAKNKPRTSALGRRSDTPVEIDSAIFGDINGAARQRAIITPENWDFGVAQLLPTQLVIRAELTEEEWLALGEKLRFVEGGIQWWIGDWMRYGQHRWGEKINTVVGMTGKSEQRVKNYQWVASRFETSRRRDLLSYTHHELVAAMPMPEQEEWLDYAVAERLSSKDLQRLLRERNQPDEGEQFQSRLHHLSLRVMKFAADLNPSRRREFAAQLRQMADEIEEG